MAGQVEVLTGRTKYSLLAPAPLLTFGDPVASIVLPKSLAGTQSLLAVRRVPGQQTTGNLAVYLQIVFVPRRRTVTITCPDGTSPQSLSD